MDSSLARSLVQDFMNYTPGENVVKMIPWPYDLPLQDRQELIEAMLEPVIEARFR